MRRGTRVWALPGARSRWIFGKTIIAGFVIPTGHGGIVCRRGVGTPGTLILIEWDMGTAPMVARNEITSVPLEVAPHLLAQ